MKESKYKALLKALQVILQQIIIPKKLISYRSYIDKQIVDFIFLIIEMIPIKDVTSRKGIILSIVYHFWKTCNGNQKVPEKKKRNIAKKNGLKVERTVFIVKITDNFALMILEQKWETLTEKYPRISISKT